MARAGDVLENPVTGERVVFHRTARETNGEALEYELFFRPSGFAAQDHLHPKQEETHEVVSGVLGMTIAGRDVVLHPGNVEVVPARTPHRLWSRDDEPIHLRVEIRPALRQETLIETFVGLAREGKVNAKGYPNLLQLAVISRAYEDEGYALKPPLAVQRALFGPLAALGRALGYRARYPQYSGD
jgi:mannose-6-phosphate isomerase-like protein (cupin superfamily)